MATVTTVSTIEFIQEKIDELTRELNDIQSQMDNFEISYYVDHSMFDEYLDEVYGDQEICGMTYSASYVLKLVDQFTYNEDYNNWIDSLDETEHSKYKELEEEYEDIENELSDLNDELEMMKEELEDE